MLLEEFNLSAELPKFQLSNEIFTANTVHILEILSTFVFKQSKIKQHLVLNCCKISIVPSVQEFQLRIN